MKKTSVLLLLSFLSANSWAVKLSDYTPYKFEALFTNPECETYYYNRPLTTVGGKTVDSKPDNVYCKQSDEGRSVSRKTSPQYRLTEWITAKSTKEIYMAYLSFSSKNIAEALCEAVGNGVKVTIVLDHGDPDAPSTTPAAENLRKCNSDQSLVNINYRGSTGGLGYAHNKILMVNPNSKSEVKIVFSSGNMSSGTSINHENWNFVTTSPESYFAQTHKCAVDGMIEAGFSKAEFNAYLNQCRSKIKAEPESDIKVFFIPTDAKSALATFNSAGNRSKSIEGMSHRLSGEIARSVQSFIKKGIPVKFIMDDDVYWSIKRREDIGRNTSIEAARIFRDLVKVGMQIKFLQTNQIIFQLQHNKFMIFNFSNGGAVFNGAGNFTSAAFTKNYENFYYITIPEVVQAYKTQYDKYYNEMATSESEMTKEYVLP